MRRIIFCISLITSFVCFAGAGLNTKEFKLDNGLKLIVREDSRAPVVISEVWYKVGSSYEPLGITGISHMLEHMMFKGTAKFPRDTFSESISSVGGRMNAFTSFDNTGYYLKLPKEQLELSMQIESDRMRDLLFDNNEFLKERNVVAEERRLRTDNVPSSNLTEKLLATAMVASPYHHPVIGWMQDIQEYTLDDIKAWYKRYYAPNNAVLVIVGDVKADLVFEMAKKYFGDLQPSIIPKYKTKHFVPGIGKRTIDMKIDKATPELQVIFNAPGLTTAREEFEPYALELLSFILTGGGASRLHQELVVNQKIASEVSSFYMDKTIHDSLFHFSAMPTPGKDLNALRQAIFTQLENIKNNNIDSKELKRAKMAITADNIYARDSMYTQARIIGSFETIGLSWQDADRYVDNIQKVTAEQIREVANKYFVEENLSIGTLLPKSGSSN